MRLRIVVDGMALCVADEAPGLGRLAEVCSRCYHEPQYDDPVTCPEHPTAPLELVIKLTAAMLRAMQVEVTDLGRPPHLAVHQGGPGSIGVARQNEPTHTTSHQGAPIGIARQHEDPVGDVRQAEPPHIAAHQGGVGRQNTTSRQGGPVDIARQLEKPVGVVRQADPSHIAAHQGAPIGAARQTEESLAARRRPWVQMLLPFPGPPPPNATPLQCAEWTAGQRRFKYSVTSEMGPPSHAP